MGGVKYAVRIIDLGGMDATAVNQSTIVGTRLLNRLRESTSSSPYPLIN